MTPRRPTVLVSVGYYHPSRRAGGPVRSLTAMAARLSDEFDFRVVAPHHDVGSEEPFDGVPADTWTPVGAATVRYLPAAAIRAGAVPAVIRATPHDVLYLNSTFHARFTLAPLLDARRRGGAPSVVVAPRGELSPGALTLKAYKKRPFLLLGRALGLYRDVLWHATSDEEAHDVRREFGARVRLHVAGNLAAAPAAEERGLRPPKRAGALRLVFLSRIMAKKGLLLALEAAGSVGASGARIELDVYGPVEDQRYWRRCQEAIRSLSAATTVRYRGVAAPDDVHRFLADYDAFILPTLGENHGHAIVEAMASGVPVIVSDRTPWRDLERRRVGFDLPLERQAFATAIARLAALDEVEHAAWSRAARAFGVGVLHDPEPEERTRELFREALRRQAAG